MLKETKQEERLVKRKKERKTKEIGITLVALVITVIIIIILATVTINFAFGENGLIKRAEQASEFYANDTKYTEDSVANVEKYLDGMLPGGSGEVSESIPETTSYVGYYADVDGNGSVDGIIYADLAQPKSGQWTDSNGTYSYTNPENLKKYKVEGTDSIDGFGSKGIVKPNGGSGNERFYVMALNDVDTKTHCWYYSAYDYGMDDYATYTSVNFGTGEQNTSKMITKWNASGYGSQNGNSSYPDVWGLSAVQSGTWNGSSGWYVPSKQEWAAFGDAFSITSGNYSSTFGLSNYYWSSSQCNTNRAWHADFGNGCMSDSYVDNYFRYVRLGTTF